MSPSGEFTTHRYRRSKLLGQGGQGRVYLADDLLEGGRKVALKIFPPAYSFDRLRREFATLAGLRHPGIARAHHFGVSDDAPFLSMEYLAGRSLDEHLQGLPVENRVEQALPILDQCASALDYLHRRGILHLDIKPDNILIVDAGAGRTPQAVLIDFGLVRAPDSPRVPLNVGTAAYAAPELFRGETPTASYDLYSLGASFYKAIVGKAPFSAKSVSDYRNAHLKRAPASPTETPPALAELLLRLLAKHANDRFASAADLRRALRDHVGAEIDAPPLFHEPAFVGRRGELHRFETWSRTESRSLPLVVAGASGLGKSRLLDQFEIDLYLQSRDVVRVSVSSRQENLLDATVSRVVQLRPQVESSVEENLLLSLIGIERPRRETQRLIESSSASVVEQSLVRIGGRRVREYLESGGFLLIDDADLLDERGEKFLTEVASGPSPASGGVVITTGDGNDSQECLANRTADDHWIELAPLEESESAGLEIAGVDEISSGLDPSAMKRFHETLFRETSGHPLYYLQGLLLLGGDAIDTESAADRLSRRLSQRSPGARTVLTDLALSGRLATFEELGAKERADLPACLRELSQSGFVLVDDYGVRIVANAVRDAVLRDLTEQDKQSAHSRLATRLLSSNRFADSARHYYAAGDTKRGLDVVQQLATQLEGKPWWNAGPTDTAALEEAAEQSSDDVEQRDRFLELASDLHASRGRFEESAARLLSTESVVRKAPKAKGDRATWIRRQRKLGCAYHRAGQMEHARKHLTACLEATEASEEFAEDRIRAIAEEALLCHYARESEEAQQLAIRGLDSWKGLEKKRQSKLVQAAIDLHGILGQIHLRRFESEAAITWLKKGAELVRRAMVQTHTAILLNNLALAYHMENRLRLALTTFGEAEDAARRLGEDGALVSVLCNQVQIHAKLGDFRRAHAVLGQVRELDLSDQSRRSSLSIDFTAALVGSLAGTETHESWSAVESAARDSGDLFLSHVARLYLAEASLKQGRLERASGELDGDDWPEVLKGARLARLSVLHAFAGRLEDSESAATAYFDQDQPRLLEEWNLIQLARAAAECGHAARAKELLTAAQQSFQKAGANTGRLECALAFAELAVDRGQFSEARRRAATAERLSLYSESGSIRKRELRTAVVEAKIAVHELSHSGPSEERESRLQDLVSRATFGAVRGEDLQVARDTFALRSIHATLRSDPEQARRITIELRTTARAAGCDLRLRRRLRDAAAEIGQGEWSAAIGRVRLD
ncbi:MAG: protein kinase, partial [Planctomycetota bacterium]